MKIIRADHFEINNPDFFSEETGAKSLLFVTENLESRFRFVIINKNKALLEFKDSAYLDDVIEEFIFYNGFISKITDKNGDTIWSKEPVVFKKVEIKAIQPSQFYSSDKKIAACGKFIESAENVLIPIAYIEGKIISLDGHSRMKAALDKGIVHAYCYAEEYGCYINDFVDMANKRGVFSPDDIPVLPDKDYREKWHRFCDDYFESKK